MVQVILRLLTNAMIYGGALGIAFQWIWRQYVDANVQFQWVSICVLLISLGGVIASIGSGGVTGRFRAPLTAMIYSALTASFIGAFFLSDLADFVWFWWDFPAWPVVLSIGVCLLVVTISILPSQFGKSWALPLILGCVVTLSDALLLEWHLIFQTAWYLLNSDYLALLVLSGLFWTVTGDSEYMGIESNGLKLSYSRWADATQFLAPLGIVSMLFAFSANVNPAQLAALLLIPWLVLVLVIRRLTSFFAIAACVIQTLVVFAAVRGVATLLESMVLGFLLLSCTKVLRGGFSVHAVKAEIHKQWRTDQISWAQNASVDLMFFLVFAIIIVAFLPWSLFQVVDSRIIYTLYVAILASTTLLPRAELLLLLVLPFLANLGYLVNVEGYQTTLICLILCLTVCAQQHKRTLEVSFSVLLLCFTTLAPEATNWIEEIRFW